MELEEMTAFFTSRLDLYDEHMLREVPGCRAGYARMAALLPEGTARLLDLGCGTGLELEPIFARFPALRVTGVDLTAAMLDRLRAKFPDRDLTLIRGSYVGMDFGRACYDAAVSFETLHHLEPEEKGALYRRVWEGECYAPENTVMVHIRRIREKIELNPKEPDYIKVVWGIGYKMEQHGS